MKAFKVIYKHGHFIDIETQQRIIPVQGSEYMITAADEAFKTEDSKLAIGTSLSTKEKKNWAEEKFGIGKFVKILNVGEQLFFRVGNAKRADGDEDRQYIFACNLLEDLYLYLSNDKEGDKEEDWRLADCKCELDTCLLGGLTLSEKVPATSLNKLFSHTVQFYFSMQRSGSTNALSSFFLYQKGMEITFDGAIRQPYESLASMRKRISDDKKVLSREISD